MFGFKLFTKIPKHQQFGYKPMYYDAHKEELESRLSELKNMENKESIEGSKARISSGMRRSYLADQEYRKRQVFRSNIILFGVLLMLAVLGYMLLGVYLPELSKFLGE